MRWSLLRHRHPHRHRSRPPPHRLCVCVCPPPGLATCCTPCCFRPSTHTQHHHQQHHCRPQPTRKPNWKCRRFCTSSNSCNVCPFPIRSRPLPRPRLATHPAPTALARSSNAAFSRAFKTPPACLPRRPIAPITARNMARARRRMCCDLRRKFRRPRCDPSLFCARRLPPLPALPLPLVQLVLLVPMIRSFPMSGSCFAFVSPRICCRRRRCTRF